MERKKLLITDEEIFTLFFFHATLFLAHRQQAIGLRLPAFLLLRKKGFILSDPAYPLPIIF